MPRDTSPDPEFEPESLPPLGPLPLDNLPSDFDWGPPRSDPPPPEDYGIPGIELDHSGRIKVPKRKARGPKADSWLLEQARCEFFVGMNLDVPTSIAWLWPERIAIGKLTLIEGESDSGTSFLVTNMAARVSSESPWPGTSVAVPAGLPPISAEPVGSPPAGSPVFLSHPARHVLFVSGGDNTGDTLTPRLINGGANLADLTIFSRIDARDTAEMRKGKADTNRRLVLPADLGHIEYQLRQRPDTRLVVVDSLSDFCRTHNQYRETLRGLHEMAERCQVAIVATARPKNDRRARSRLTPSTDRRSESARRVFNVLIDPHDRSQRYLAPARINFCREPRWLPFRIGEGVVEWGQPLETAPVAGDDQENGAGENGTGDEAVGQIGSEEHARQGEQEPTPAEEFAGVDFERMPRRLVLAALDRLQTLEAAAMGKPSQNGKPGKNGKRKPR